MESESFKKLLHALDVKHISGWYHPAMRLQVEVHNLEGVNEEIRQQLDMTRKELNECKKKLMSMGKDTVDLQYSQNTLDIDTSKLVDKNLLEKLEYYQKEYAITAEQVKLLYAQYENEKLQWQNKEKELLETQNQSAEQLEILQNKVKETTSFLNILDDDYKKLQKLNELSENATVLNRKCLYFENSEKTAREEISELKENLKNAQVAITNKITAMNDEKITLTNKITQLQHKLVTCVEIETHENEQRELDKLQIKHRELMKQLVTLQENHEFETKQLKEQCKWTQSEIEELRVKLKDAISNNYEQVNNDIEQKLAEVEVAEITERQRANHTNNLYELVKEQLKKSEEKFLDFEKFSKDLVHKNLMLQETVKALEDKVLVYVDTATVKVLQESNEKLLEANTNLQSENNNLHGDILNLQEKIRKQILKSGSQEYEFLSLKHQIVDLQSSSDDKAVIARLSSDVVHARLLEASAQKELEKVSGEVKTLEKHCMEFKHQLSNLKKLYEDRIKSLEGRNLNLCEVIRFNRKNFYGYVPYVSESRFVENICEMSSKKQEEIIKLQSICNEENDAKILKESLNEEIKLVQELKSAAEDDVLTEKIDVWLSEKNTGHLQELKLKRQNEFKTLQLQQALQHISTQEQQIVQLEEQLFKSTQISERMIAVLPKHVPIISQKADKETNTPKQELEAKTLAPKAQKGVQTLPTESSSDESSANIAILINMQNQQKQLEDQLAQKDIVVQELKTKITELEMNISMFRTQIGDKTSQIKFYEKYILELQTKKEVSSVQSSNDSSSNSQSEDKSEEIISLKSIIGDLQEKLSQKDVNIVQYQTLLKKDRDEHSLAAARMQEEVKRLNNLLTSQNLVFNKMKENKLEIYPTKAIFEQYFQQVHALEKHSCDIHVSMQQLTEQLKVVKEEAITWKELADTRHQSLQRLEDQFQFEVDKKVIKYKQECEKWQNEVSDLKLLIQECRNETSTLRSIKDILKEKENKIHELSSTIRQVKMDLKKQQESIANSPRINELESENSQLKKDIENTRKKIDGLLKKDKNLREEIRSLKGQLIKRPMMSARSDKSDSTIREQNLQKKVSNQEEEIEQLKNQLEKQLTINEAHRIKVGEDFDKWSKMKHFQQLADKFKGKLKAKEEECSKLQHTCSGYRVLIERLEREKHGLEARVKTLKNSCTNITVNRLEHLEMDNMKLRGEVEILTSKLEMQHHHSGGLGAVMLQEKLEAQERKIAVLELSAKGTGEIRAEMERLHSTIGNLQKANLRLESENLELNLDLQKIGNDSPHLREQIQHLENYIEVLKAEKGTSVADFPVVNESKKTSELERTVFVLKRLVEKLQAENKRLQGDGRRCSSTNRTASEEKLRGDLKQVKEQYADSLKKITRLEDALIEASERIKAVEKQPLSQSYSDIAEELSNVKLQLSQKSQLLEKVKVLLQRAATKEKALLEEVASLRLKITEN